MGRVDRRRVEGAYACHGRQHLDGSEGARVLVGVLARGRDEVDRAGGEGAFGGV